jgi:hypothetical protein
MNWKLIFILSIFGVAMGFGTLWIPSKLEPLLWLIIFIFCAWSLVNNIEKKAFLNGFLLGMANCAWTSVIRINFANIYLAHHSKEAEQYFKMQMQSGGAIWQWLLFTNIISGLMSAVVLGIFTVVAAAILRKMS